MFFMPLVFFQTFSLAKPAPKKSFTQIKASTETVCELEGFVTEIDPKGLNVRERAAKGAKILGVIPPALFEKKESGLGYLVKPEVKIIGSENGWIKIKDAREAGIFEELIGLKPRKMYSGVGWVYGQHLTVKSQAKSAYAEPTKKSRILHSESAEMNFDRIDSFQLLGCQGEWAHVFDKDLKKDHQYWLDKICGLQETTCSGLGDDPLESK